MRVFPYILIAFLFFSPALFSQGQSTVADSIEHELNALNPESPNYLQEKAGIMGTLLQTVKYSDPQKALRLCDQLGEVFMQIGDSAKAYEAMYRYKAGIYDIGGQMDKMLTSLEAYADALSSIGKSDGYVYLDIGNVYFGFGMYGLARENYYFAEQIFTEQGNTQGVCTIYNNFAQMHMAGKNYDSALVWLHRSYNLRLYTLKDPVLAHESLYLMAKVFRDMQQYDSAYACLAVVINDLKGTALQQHTDHIALHQEFAGAYTAMGITFYMQQQWDSAEYYFRQGEQLYQRYSYQIRMPFLYSAWTRMYIAKHDAASAKIYLDKTEANTDRHNPNELMELYSLYGDYYDLTGEKEKAYFNRLQFYKLDDSIQASGYEERTIIAGSHVLQLQNQARIDGQNAELERKEKEAHDSRQQRTIFLVLSCGLGMLIIVGAISLYQLRKKNKLIEKYNSELHVANATKEQLLSVVSHDLRGPFNTLIGISDLMVRNMRNRDYASVTGNAELIRESSRKAYVLLDNLMQWVSLQKETIRVRKDFVVLNELVDEILLLFRGQALANSSTVLKDIRVEHAMTDRNLLQVIIRNLVSNALKAIPVAGHVKVSMSAMGKDLKIMIEDNGRGLNEDDLATLFAPKDKTRIARQGGGLGLLLVDQFVRQLGGMITAENVEAGGARFTIILYDAVQQAAPAEGPAKQEDPAPLLTAKDKQLIGDIVTQLKGYEIYDTTEIREVVGKIPESSSAGVEWWKKKILEAVYRSDETRFRTLLNMAVHEDIRQ